MADPWLDRVLLDRFRIVAAVGSGAHARVYRAWDEETGEAVALKILAEELALGESPEARGAIERFRREARLLAVLGGCPATPQIVAADVARAPYWIAMELMQGPTLRRLLQARPEGMRPGGFLMLAERVISGVEAIHVAGVLHRDLAPENIVIIDDGRELAVRFLDFGIGKPLEAEVDPVTRNPTVAGTPQYLSPEQARGLPPGTPSDVYALGAILYEMATGSVPIAVRGIGEVARIRRQIPQDVRESSEWMPPDLGAAIMSCLAKQPEDRPRLPRLHALVSELARRPEWGRGDDELRELARSDDDARSRPADAALPSGDFGRWRLIETLPSRRRGSRLHAAIERASGRAVRLEIFDEDDDLDELRLAAGRAMAARKPTPRERATISAERVEDRIVWCCEPATGRTLAAVLDADAPLDHNRVLQIGVEILHAVGEMHAHGAAHGHLDPEAIELDDFDVVTLRDAGRPLEEPRVAPFAAPAVSAPYAAPEVRAGAPASVGADVHSCAALLLALVVGRAPFGDTVFGSEHAQVEGLASSRAAASASSAARRVTTALKDALHPDPARRPGDVATLQARFVRALAVEGRIATR